jgi:hypothetical protein
MRSFFVTVVLGVAVALAGCGDDESGSPETGSSQLADKPANQVLADVADALGELRSYHVEGDITDEDGRSTLSGDVSSTGKSHLRFQQAAQHFELIVIDDTSYLRANSAFWREQAGSGDTRVTKLLTDRWIKTRDRDQRKIVDGLLPSTLAACITKDHGTVTKKGVGKVGDKPTIVLHDDGDSPGGAPGDLHVAADGRPLPLRVLQTGPEKATKHPDPKCESDSKTKASDIALSRFDEPVKILAPSGALDFDAVTDEGGQSA